MASLMFIRFKKNFVIFYVLKKTFLV